MHDIYKYERRYKYPHMSPADTTIWEKFMDSFPTRYNSVDYDFALGGTPLSSEQIETISDANMLRLWQKRIDVISEQEGETHIIEVKPNAGPGALGQVLSYKELYKQYVNPEKKCRAILITDRQQPDMAMLAANMGVELFVV